MGPGGVWEIQPRDLGEGLFLYEVVLHLRRESPSLRAVSTWGSENTYECQLK